MLQLRYPVHRVVLAAAAAVLMLCTMRLSLVAAAVTTDFTTSEQANTLAFLQGVSATNAVLAAA